MNDADGLRATGFVADPIAFVRAQGRVLRSYEPPAQDSGNVSWLVQTADRLLFVKTAGPEGPPPPGGHVPYFDHAGRVRLLHNAIELSRSCDDPALAELLAVLDSSWGPMLVYAGVPGELVHVRGEQKADPGSAYRRFARLPADILLGVFDVLYDLHRELAAVGWVASDLYDGCLIVDFATGATHVIDLDTYRRGPSRNDMGRMFGSSRFMAPEEFELGAPVDERTTVFTLGRLGWHFGTRLSDRWVDFCGPDTVAEVLQQAVRPDRADRYATVAEFATAWSAARSARS